MESHGHGLYTNLIAAPPIDRRGSFIKVSEQAPRLNDNRVVQGLWIGSPLSIMERLSIKSFLDNGHEYHLYTYDELKDVPAGTVIKDGNEILPASAIFKYKDRPSYSAFSNFFRYKLLLERGGWWVDTDVICLKPFDFPEEHVFATEKLDEREVVSRAELERGLTRRAIEQDRAVVHGLVRGGRGHAPAEVKQIAAVTGLPGMTGHAGGSV